MDRVSRLTLLPGPRPLSVKDKAWQIVGILLVAILCYYAWVVVLSIVVALVLLILSINLMTKESDYPLSGRPETESICTFARALPYREIDPEVIRAVYEELASSCWIEKGRPCPLRPTDSLLETLGIEEDELELSVAETIAYRTRRTLADSQKNPLYGKVITAGDLVVFLNSQPKVVT